MDANELYELVKPLIGTACEPEDLAPPNEHNEHWWHEWAHAGDDVAGIDIEADVAAALWEVAVGDWFGRQMKDNRWGTKTDDDGVTVFAVEVVKKLGLLANVHCPFGYGPTRLHALVAAAQSVMRVRGDKTEHAKC